MDRGPTVVSLRFGHYTSWGNGLSNLGLRRWKRQLELGISLVTWRSSKCHEWSLTQSIGGGILTSGCLFRCRRLLVKVSITRWHCTIRMRSLINASLLLFWHAWAWLSMVALSPFFISPGEAGPPVMIQRCKPLIISVEQRSRTYYAQRTHPVPSIRFGWFMKPKSQSWNDFLVGRWPSLSMCDSGFRRTTSLKFPYHNTTPFIGIITSAAAYGLPTKPDLRKILIKTNMYYQIEWGGW